MFESVMETVNSLSDKHGVDPVIFGVIYIGAIPFFWISVAWLVKSVKDGKSAVPPIISSGFFFISSYLYIILFGRDVPWWVYAFIAAFVGFTGWSTVKKIRGRVSETAVQ